MDVNLLGWLLPTNAGTEQLGGDEVTLILMEVLLSLSPQKKYHWRQNQH
ncbi:MAG: hypothetical protein KME29_08970 [Calothrix sp. FI2-JRJ7]|nr:hypothetical protein [Calothrix sp. FI2-JRJ7]